MASEGFIVVMGDEQDGFADRLLQFDQMVPHAPADQRIERRKSLVHEDDFRIECEGAGKAHALLLATQKPPGTGLFISRKTHDLDPLGGFLEPLGFGHAP